MNKMMEPKKLNAVNPIHVLWFYDQPTKPCFVLKGTYRNVLLHLPDSHMSDEIKPFKNKIQAQFSSATDLQNRMVINVPELPTNLRELDLTLAKQLPKTSSFSSFIPAHLEGASTIINHLLNVKSEFLVSLAAKIQLEVNPYLFEYALSIALMHREDTRHVPLPSPFSHVPEFFLRHEIMNKATQQGNVVIEVEDRNPIDIPVTATDHDIEHRVAYFREDIGVNIHHWHWHLVYPHDIKGQQDLVNKDRRGELFYYMHQQICARYDSERLCNKLLRVKSLNYLREEIDPPYFPKLGAPFSDKTWASRHMGTFLKDVNRDGFMVQIPEMELWQTRILDAIHFGGYYDENNKFYNFEEETGINILGNMIESSMFSPRRKYYGEIHNYGHLIIAFSHDPDNRYLEGKGVMGDNRTAMRDPIFYRWHKHVDDIFYEFKSKLTPYTRDQLNFDKVRITSLRVVTKAKVEIGEQQDVESKLITYVEKDKLNLAHGVDVASAGPVHVIFPHLQHCEFNYEINVRNDSENDKIGNVRIFLAPKIDETLERVEMKHQRFLMKDQHRLFIELDKFTYKLKAKATTQIFRSSKQSSVTIPFKQMFLDIDDILKNEDDYKKSQTAYCGCGWPQHMLIPRGEIAGSKFQLFVMISDYNQDKVEDKSTDAGITSCCKPAPSYCGLKSQKYPDKRPMGYPFDRPPNKEVTYIEQFLTDNMSVIDVDIIHKDVILNGQTLNN